MAWVPRARRHLWTARDTLAYKRPMRLSRTSRSFAALVFFVATVACAAEFNWNWRNQETIGRNDPSLGNTSRITDNDRAALIAQIVARLQKPLRAQGYEDDRIREIASTTRVRFVDLGDGNTAILATSLGLEGGCDVLVNCPFWIFRQQRDKYVAILDTTGASYTVQPTRTNGLSDLVIARHDTPNESRLTVYSFNKLKYREAGCYVATWTEAKAGNIGDPELTACSAKGAH